MFYNNSGNGYTHCRSGSDSVIHRRSSVGVGLGRDADIFDSADSALSDLDGKWHFNMIITALFHVNSVRLECVAGGKFNRKLPAYYRQWGRLM